MFQDDTEPLGKLFSIVFNCFQPFQSRDFLKICRLGNLLLREVNIKTWVLKKKSKTDTNPTRSRHKVWGEASPKHPKLRIPKTRKELLHPQSLTWLHLKMPPWEKKEKKKYEKKTSSNQTKTTPIFGGDRSQIKESQIKHHQTFKHQVKLKTIKHHQT